MSALLKRFPGASLAACCRGFLCKGARLEQPQSGRKVQRSRAWLLRRNYGRPSFSNRVLPECREGLKIGHIPADREAPLPPATVFRLSVPGQRAPVDYDRAAAYSGMIAEKDVLVPMRDGVKIAIDVYRPDTTEKLPALLAFSIHNKDLQGPDVAETS